jgi:hypothetical protein
MPNQISHLRSQIEIEIESNLECSRQIAFFNARGTDGTEKFAGAGR